MTEAGTDIAWGLNWQFVEFDSIQITLFVSFLSTWLSIYTIFELASSVFIDMWNTAGNHVK